MSSGSTDAADAPNTIRRALLSVSDKAGLVELARALADRGVELISTGGTSLALRDAGLIVRDVSDLTGFPEILGGRVKTLHPAVHGGILADRAGAMGAEHAGELRRHGIGPIDLVVVNLYPFAKVAQRAGVGLDELIEYIDIGGVALLRAAAKNHHSVAVVSDPAMYDELLADLGGGAVVSAAFRRRAALAAFAVTASYDATIHAALSAHGEASAPVAERVTVDLRLARPLRYGENPHQPAGLYRVAGGAGGAGPSLVDAAQTAGGKELSYNNLMDASAALECALDLARGPDGGMHPSCVVVKHTNPCGAASGSGTSEVIRAALGGDPRAAYGGVLAVAGPIDAGAATALLEGGFLEVVCGFGVSAEAREILSGRWSNLRLLDLGADRLSAPADALPRMRAILGGMLVQERDAPLVDPGCWVHAAGPAPGEGVLRAAGTIWACVRHLTSNAIAIGGTEASGTASLFGAGSGQQDRVWACRIAIEKAGERARGAIACSDAFFPFPDGPELLIDAGVSVIVHPGGSKRDQETFELCERRGVTCLTTGMRHFRH